MAGPALGPEDAPGKKQTRIPTLIGYTFTRLEKIEQVQSLYGIKAMRVDKITKKVNVEGERFPRTEEHTNNMW